MTDRHNLIKPPNFPAGYFVNPISGIIYYRARIKGRAQKFSTGKKTIKEARSYVENRLLEILSDNPNKARREKKGILNISVQQAWDDLMAERVPQKEPATITKNLVSWNSMREFWQSKTVNQINPKTIKAFENWYLENHPTRVFFNTHKDLTMLLNFCFREGYISKPPKISDLDIIIKARTQHKKVGRVYTEKEIIGLLEATSAVARDPETCLKARIGILMGARAGLRKKEALAIEWSNVDLKNHKMKVWSFKNKKWREVPLADELILAIADLKATQKKGKYLFPMASDPTRFLSSQLFDKLWYKAQELSNLKDWDVPLAARFHDLRHTFATKTAVDNWPVVVSCQMLDMSIDEYEKTYTHTTSKDASIYVSRSFGASK